MHVNRGPPRDGSEHEEVFCPTGHEVQRQERARAGYSRSSVTLPGGQVLPIFLGCFVLGLVPLHHEIIAEVPNVTVSSNDPMPYNTSSPRSASK